MDFEQIYKSYFKDVFLYLRSLSASEDIDVYKRQEPDCASHCSSCDHMGLRENMEEEEGIWMKEIKISLPPYKMICALFFILILAIVRGISSVNEIGLTIDTYVTLLALVLCCLLYTSRCV